MEKHIIYLNGQNVDDARMQEILCSHIAGNNKTLLNIVREYHSSEVKEIGDYIMTIFNNDYVDARTLNFYYHMALSELNIDTKNLTLPSGSYQQDSLAKAVNI